MARLEVIDEDLPGLYPSLNGVPGHHPNDSVHQRYSKSADDLRGVPSLFDRFNPGDEKYSPDRGSNPGRRGPKDNDKKDNSRKKKGKEEKRRFSEGTVPPYSKSGEFYDAYNASSSPAGFSSYPGGAPLPNISGSLPGPYGRRYSHGDVDVRSQASYNSKSSSKPKKPVGSTSGTSSVLDDVDSKNGGGSRSSASAKYSNVTINNNNKNNNTNQSKNNNDKNLNTNNENSPGKLPNKTNNKIKRSESNDDLVSSVLSASNRSGKQAATITLVTQGGNTTVLDIPGVPSTRARLRNLVSPITTFLIVVAMLAALSIAVYFAVEMKESQEEQIEILKAKLNMRVAQNSGTRDFSQLTSSELEQLKAAYCKQVDEFYKQSAMGQDYRGCEVVTLTNERIQFNVFFVDTPTAAKEEDTIVQVLARQATQTGVQGERILNINDIRLDVSDTSRTVELQTTFKDQDFYGADSRKEVQDNTPQRPPLPPTLAATASTLDSDGAIQQTILDICNSTNQVLPVAHPHSCSHYIQCEFNRSIVMPCAGGLVFDPDSIVCVKPRDDLPCREITPCKDLNGGYFAHPSNCRLYVICDQGKSRVMSCKEQVWDDESKNCLPRKRGTDCDKARRQFNRSIVMSCAGGLVFDPDSIVCVKPRDDLLCREITPCKDLNGGYFAHPSNCRLYVICDQGKSRVMSCKEQINILKAVLALTLLNV
ncbi:hypothetical protein EGW08_003916 [Elysia chlorotica]|uniref:Chitin-binding type-2 domain-containing protein n=1 Tax=Elysia chlorotica TaxID=188477 RepID=A0A433U3F6_ELYCH|nr:hypothetical protein EGW08_003916 [Elysia chlorotica]